MPNQPPIAPTLILEQARQRALIGRGAPSYQVHWAAPASTATSPLTARAKVIQHQARNRAVLGRTVPRPHLPAPIVTPGGPPPALEGLIVQITIWRPPAPSTALRRTPRPHLAPAIRATPAPPVKPGRIITQAIRRPLVGRTVPRPHLPAPNISHAPPVRRGTVITQALRRPLLGRRVIGPHHAGPIVLPASAIPAPPRIHEPTSVQTPSYASSATTSAYASAVFTPAYAVAVDTPGYATDVDTPAYEADVTTPTVSGGK